MLQFHRYRSNEKNIIIATLLKLAGYIHNHKILHGNIFGLILKNKMATTGVFFTFSKDFCSPPRAKGIIERDLKFAGYVPYYKILTGNIFGLILKNKMAAMGVSLKSAISPLLLVLEAWYVKPTNRKSWGGNDLMRSDLTLDPFFKVKRGLLVLEVWDGKPTYRKSWAGNLLVCSDLTLDPSFKIKRGLLVLEVWDGKPAYRKSWAGNLLMCSDLTLDPSFKIKLG